MVEVQYLGHSSFKISDKGCCILIDPVMNWSSPKEFEYLIKPRTKECDFKKASLILITHEHFDHFDKGTVERVAKTNSACVVAHPNILQTFDGAIQKAFLHPISISQTVSLRGVTVEAVPAHHPQSFYPLGFMITINGKKIYHAGDTELIDDMAKLKPDVAIVPIGGYGTMDCVDAVRAIKTMKPRFAVPMHYNTFKQIMQDPKEFKQKIEKSILKTKVVILKPGKKFSFV